MEQKLKYYLAAGVSVAGIAAATLIIILAHEANGGIAVAGFTACIVGFLSK